jgi:two-component system nitrate/nitrite response regulator NarL
MIVIASNSTSLAMRWTRALRGKYRSCIISEKSALEESMSRLKPCVLLLDTTLPRLHVARDLRNIQRLSPSTKIIALATTPDPNEALAMLKAGAKGYCVHKISTAMLRKAVRAVMTGEFWAGRKVVAELIDNVIAAESRRRLPKETGVGLANLSPRQREIAAMVADGARNKDIAAHLGISEAAVKAHLGALFRKFNLSTRLELARLFAATTSHGAASSR